MEKNSLLARADRPLALPTYDGSGQCVHPDVVRPVPSLFGAEFAMIMEPYPYGDDFLENPSFLVSHDGISWAAPFGLINPIVAPPPVRGPWHSDADLLIANDSTLAVYYRYNSGQGEATCFRKVSIDGIRWSQAQKLFTVAKSGTFASPALVRSDEIYYMYYVDTTTQTVRVCTSKDGVTWGETNHVLWFTGAWHLDAVQVEDSLYLLINAHHTLFLLRTSDRAKWFLLTENGWDQYHCGLDRRGRADALPIVLPSEIGWDNDWIYRSTFLIERDVLRLWYGAKSKRNEWNVGYTCGAIP